jgi:predicted TIM-barrel fold metal-dependent hydrolase
MPFAMNESTRFISPTKTLEYLAAGKPIVSTPVRDVIGMFGDVVRVAADADGFCKPAVNCLRSIRRRNAAASAATQARAPPAFLGERRGRPRTRPSRRRCAFGRAHRQPVSPLTQICRHRTFCRRSPAWAERGQETSPCGSTRIFTARAPSRRPTSCARSMVRDVDFAVLLAPFLSEGYSLDDAASLSRANDHLARLVRGHADRLAGFAVVDPRDPGAASELRRAVESGGLRGVKMVPTGWYPYDRGVQPVFAEAQALDIPILFHSGIFIDGRSGRFLPPELLRGPARPPGLRITLAHLGWPWTDEAIAVGLIDRIHGVPPDDDDVPLRHLVRSAAAVPSEVLRRALDVARPRAAAVRQRLLPALLRSHLAERIGWVEALFDELELDPSARARIWAGTAASVAEARAGFDPDPAGAPSRRDHRDRALRCGPPLRFRLCC